MYGLDSEALKLCVEEGERRLQVRVAIVGRAARVDGLDRVEKAYFARRDRVAEGGGAPGGRLLIAGGAPALDEALSLACESPGSMTKRRVKSRGGLVGRMRPLTPSELMCHRPMR